MSKIYDLSKHMQRAFYKNPGDRAWCLIVQFARLVDAVVCLSTLGFVCCEVAPFLIFDEGFAAFCKRYFKWL